MCMLMSTSHVQVLSEPCARLTSPILAFCEYRLAIEGVEPRFGCVFHWRALMCRRMQRPGRQPRAGIGDWCSAMMMMTSASYFPVEE